MSWKFKARAVSHKINLFLGTRCRGVAPMTFVMGFPKSGTTWACQLVADYTEKPFPRYNLFPTACPAVIHGHELPVKGVSDQVYVVRDGRDALVSMYNQFVKAYKPGQKLSRYHSKTLPGYQEGKPVANMCGFIQAQAKLAFSSPCNWSEHVIRSYETLGENIAVLKFEELVGEHPEQHLLDAMVKLTGDEPNPKRAAESIARYAFSKQAKRVETEIAHFMNKGQAGNWRNYFTRATAQAFVDTMGDGLITAGYEQDHSWVDDVPESLDEPG